jgi:hypothetical protein
MTGDRDTRKIACPYCGHRKSAVTDSRPDKDTEEVVRRRRRCLGCDKRFFSFELSEGIFNSLAQGLHGRYREEVGRDVLKRVVDVLTTAGYTVTAPEATTGTIKKLAGR